MENRIQYQDLMEKFNMNKININVKITHTILRMMQFSFNFSVKQLRNVICQLS